MKKTFVLCLVLFLTLVLSSCAPGPNNLKRTPNAEGRIAGFWLGVWHGLIAPITFIVSLFTKNVSFYEVHNNGGWYNLGFVLGAGILTGGIGGTARRCRRPRED